MAARHKIIADGEHARLGAFLRSVRVTAGVSQRTLAARLKLPQSFVSKVERGERQLQFLEFLEICSQIGVDAEEVTKQFLSSPATLAGQRVRRTSKSGPTS